MVPRHFLLLVFLGANVMLFVNILNHRTLYVWPLVLSLYS